MKKNKLFTILTLTLTLGLLTSCSFTFGGQGDNGNNSEEGKNNPIGLNLVKKPEAYLYGSAINLTTDFEVEVSYENGDVKKVGYDDSRTNGWHFKSLIDPSARAVSAVPKHLNKLGSYSYILGYAENSVQMTFNDANKAPSGEFLVRGGSFSDANPNSLSISLLRDKYFVGDIFDINSVDAVGNWEMYGGEDHIPNQDLKISGVGFDITKPLENETKHSIEISYRGIKKQASFDVLKIDTPVKSKVDYTYNNYDDDELYALNYMNTKGNPKALIVPIWFDDSSDYIAPSNKGLVKEMIRIAYLGSEEETGWHSVKTYYEQDSFHQLHIDGVLDDWYEYHEKSYNVDGDDTVALVKAVSQNYYEKLRKSNRLSEWGELDSDKDGYLDAVILIYGAPSYPYAEQNHLTVNKNLWAYCFWVQNVNENKSKPIPNAFFWASYDFMLTEQPLGSPIKVDAHTYIHEMGHILGLEDYYDYSGKTKPAGLYTMQDANVGGHDPFSRLAYGWLEPYVPTTSTTIKLKPFESSGEVIVLCPDWDGSAFNEYIIMDYWTPDGLNKLDCTYEYGGYGPLGPNVSGLRVWHVDARLSRVVLKQKAYDITADLTTKCLPDEYVDLQICNTTYNYGNSKADENGYCAEIDALRKFDLLDLLNHSASRSRSTYQFNSVFSKKHLWQPGDTFSMAEFKNSFVNVGKLNSGKDLGFTFEILSKNSQEMVIDIAKI